jgi:hypothetical protein
MATTLNKSQQRVKDVAAKQRQQNVKAKNKGFNNWHEYQVALRWKAVRFMSCVAVVGYVFADYVVKWF